MTVFGDLETSTLAELPAGRSPIQTTVVPAGERPSWLERVWQRIREEVRAGRQCYVVCPRIGDQPGDQPGEGTGDGPGDGSGGRSGGSSGRGRPAPSEDEPDQADAPADDDTPGRPPLAVLDVLAGLAEGPLHGLRLAALHGRLPVDEKERVMTEFGAGRLDVLVATTVIEVGVDVPNATVMTIMDADRFGVSQLHQLRGRIGRGSAPGICLLVTDAEPGTPARDRLDAVAATTDGFELARLDVEQRREGDVLGAAQSGRRSQLRLLSLLRDEELIMQARQEAVALVQVDARLDEHPLLAAEVARLVADEQAEYLEKA